MSEVGGDNTPFLWLGWEGRAVSCESDTDERVEGADEEAKDFYVRVVLLSRSRSEGVVVSSLQLERREARSQLCGRKSCCTDFTSHYPLKRCAKGIHVGFGSSLAHAKTVWQVEEWIAVGGSILIASEIGRRSRSFQSIYCKVT